MTVETPPERWTDDRLDELNAKVDTGFARVDENFKELRAEMKQGFEKVDGRFEALNARIDKILLAFAGLCGTIIVALIGLVGAAVL